MTVDGIVVTILKIVPREQKAKGNKQRAKGKGQ